MKIDIGCGTKKKEGYLGVDSVEFPGVDFVFNAGKDPWPWKDGTVDEVWCSHMLEHLTPEERVHFANELYRVLKPKGFATIITPHWSSCRAYGDMTHQWPPVSDFWYVYLNKEWRKQAPHGPKYTCDFVADIKAIVNPDFAKKFPEMVKNASWFMNALDDLVVRLEKANNGKS